MIKQQNGFTQLHLIDTDTELVSAWQREFEAFPEVKVDQGDILSVAKDCIVSPANSYGFMDGGLDQLYTDFFGLGPQTRLQELIAMRPEGLLPVGAALLVRTGHGRIPWMIAAPTMETPAPVPVAHAFYAMMAVLTCMDRNHRHLQEVYCPGLGTGVGQIPQEDAAREMAEAYRKFKAKQGG